ncbi:MAG: hypothetical protein LBV23_10500 [Deltaproteobacteria bacterium]|jgi:uncharacterized membrane protein|nr:hypothetical protein [Deltaproteobacteria bacterium]
MTIRKHYLLFIAFFISISLSYPEFFIGNKKYISTIDYFNNIKLSLSAYTSIKNGQFPPLVVENAFCNLGYPVHLFYSPIPYIIVSLLNFLLSNIYFSFAVTVIFSIFLAFIFIFLLVKYFFKDDIYALTASFVYVCVPYLTICRLTRGAYSEFFAMCLLPPTLYFILRYINKFSIKYLFFSVFFLFLLLNTHLITSFYFLFFSTFFLICQLIIILKDYCKTKKSVFLKKFGK